MFFTPFLYILPESVCPLLGNIFLLLPSLFYLFSWTQNLISEKNTNKSIILVTLGFLKSKCLNTEYRTCLSGGLDKGWTIEWLHNVMRHSSFFYLPALLNTVSAASWGCFLCGLSHMHQSLSSMLLHSYPQRGMWMGTGERGREKCLPQTLNQGLLFVWLHVICYLHMELPYMENWASSEFLNQWLVGEEDCHNWLRLRVSSLPGVESLLQSPLLPGSGGNRWWG